MTTTQAQACSAKPPSRSSRNPFAANVVAPGDSGYDEARAIWNAAIDGHPRSSSGARARPT